MIIDDQNGVVVFDNLLEGDREFGADTTKVTSAHAPAEVAVAANAIGKFSDCTMEDAHSSAKGFGELLKSTFA